MAVRLKIILCSPASSQRTVDEIKQSMYVKLPAGNSRVIEMQQFTFLCDVLLTAMRKV